MHETKHTSFYISVKVALDKTLFSFLFAVLALTQDLRSAPGNVR